VILNLVLNARDAIAGSGRLIIETREVDFHDRDLSGRTRPTAGAYVMLSIEDNGSGMDDETSSHLFEPFFSTKDSGRGTGLGLATVYGIVKQSNGYIEVDSKVGVGTVFRIYLPVTDEMPSGQELPQPSAKSGHETILVVEDDPGVQQVTISMLKGKGYRTLAASDAETALELCRTYNGTIHLLLTDVIMRGMNGRRLAELAVRIRPELAVLFMSGYTADVINRHGFESGIHLLEKPFSPDQLLTKVRELLQSKASA
jgi:CheY-like chemotaxis protein